MALESDFAELCFNTVTLEPFVSRDGYGKPTYGPVQTFTDTRVQDYSQLIRSTAGQEVVPSAVVYFKTVPVGIDENARITLPDGSKPKILRISVVEDTGANYYAKFYVGDGL